VGLYYTKKILEKYNGKIYVKETKEGIGSTFAIELKEITQ